MVESARKICKRFHSYIRLQPYRGKVLSVFSKAVNIQTEFGIVSLLTNTDCLHPFSCIVGAIRPFNQMNIHTDDEVLIENEAIKFPKADLAIDVSLALDMELSLDVMVNLFIPIDLNIRLRQLQRVIESFAEADDMSPMVLNTKSNPYCDLVRPRLERLNERLKEGTVEECCQAAASISGCGIGLTPSSDDLLSGFFAAYAALSQALGRNRAKVIDLTRRMAFAAAQHTTDLSGAFLLQSGEGLVSEDVFQLLRCIFSDISYPTLVAYATQVATYGSTSGTDTLTGIYLAITQHYGGTDID
ncbi:MAG: DUF2877 domain-containing protein [Eubacteriales bacterium]|nr:DUF2877 domain-containing protein [Eubacteriales bacterium]